MKKMKRLVDVLLAAVMALAMLTACGGSSSNSTEAIVLNAMNTAWGTSYGNNSNLKAKVRAVLQKVDENGRIKVSDLPSVDRYGKMYCVSDYNFNTSTGDVSMIYYIVTEDNPNSSNVSSVKAIEVTDALLEEMKNAKPGDDKTDTREIAAVGVSAYTASNGKTYIGLAIKAGNVKAQ